MNIRGKIILIVLPLIITPLLLTGVISALSARNGITSVATGFLRFKSEQLLNYAEGQWAILEENQLQDSPPFREAAESAVAAFARNLLRSPTELILALDPQGGVAMQTGTVSVSESEAQALSRLVEGRESGWQTLELGGAVRVAHAVRFEPFGWTLVVSEKREAFYSTINAIVTRTALILSISLAVSIVLLLFFTGILTRPLRDMAGVITEIISTGDLTRRVEVLYGDETGKLAHTFNLMTSELQRAYDSIKGYALEAAVARVNEQKTRKIFQKYVPNEVIERYIASPEEMLKGEDRVLAVLFSDIRSFTAISEDLRPDQLVELLNQYFSLMVDIVYARKGIADKYIGDALMAIFGAPVRHEDDALQSVLAGLEMLDHLKDFNRFQQAAGRRPWRIGIGINYGTVTVGNIGSEKKMDYTVIGDGVNVAQRLESLTKKYAEALIVSEAVEYKVREQIPCRLLDRVVVKGRTRGIGIYAPYRKLSRDQEQAWPVYHEGTGLYYDRRFEEAAKRFRKTLELLPKDDAATRFLERCRRYVASPPPADWTGAELMAEK